MRIPINIVFKDTSFVILTSISGSLMWQVCKDVYNYQINNIRINKKKNILNNLFSFNFGSLLGLGLGISYIYTGKPLIYNFIK